MKETNFEKIANIAREEVQKVMSMLGEESRTLDQYLDFVNDILLEDALEHYDILSAATDVGVPLENAWIKKFDKTFKTKKELIDFADVILSNKIVSAVDGSQIYQDRIFKIPVGLVRAYGVVAYYDGKTKPLSIDKYVGVNSMMKLPNGRKVSDNVYGLKSDIVDCHRSFHEHILEIELMKEKPDIIFSDNPLIQSYLLITKTEGVKDENIDSMLRMLYHSIENRIPVVGITDSPKTKDFCNTIKIVHEAEGKPGDINIFDAKAYEDVNILDNFLEIFDRTCVFRSNAKIMQFYDRDLNMSIHKDQPKKNVPFNSVHDLGFYYTRLSPFGIVRVELPLWIMKQKGFIDQLHEIICAQAAIGEGYPHLITEAHNGAVIRNNVAQFFVNNMVNEATKHGLSVRGSTKEIRKMIN